LCLIALKRSGAKSQWPLADSGSKVDKLEHLTEETVGLVGELLL
jgi:hypothetical protein